MPSPKSVLKRVQRLCVNEARVRARAEAAEWEQRIADVLACPDNAHLPRVEDAGVIRDGWQVMHNGIEVRVDGYYGDGITRMLQQNRGCHEPQEERLFDHMLKLLQPGAHMLELGAYWGFYSLWFLETLGREHGTAWLLEPEAANLKVGLENFLHNGHTGYFMPGGIRSHKAGTDGFRFAVDDFMRDRKLERLEVLHADVQGAEVAMLNGAERLFAEGRVDFVFISTHSDALHAECRDRVAGHGYRVVGDVELADSFSVDGVLVAVRGDLDHAPFPTVSLKRDLAGAGA